jgi:hypothetical protein
MTKQQLKSLIKECVCEIQQSLEEKKQKKSEAPKATKATKAPEPKAAAKPAPVKKLVKKPIKKNLAKVAPPKDRLTAFDAVQLSRRAADAEKRGNTQSAKDLNLAKQAANFMLKTGKSKVD